MAIDAPHSSESRKQQVDDDGDWVFALCRRGLEELLGERLKTGQEVTIEMEGKLEE